MKGAPSFVFVTTRFGLVSPPLPFFNPCWAFADDANPAFDRWLTSSTLRNLDPSRLNAHWKELISNLVSFSLRQNLPFSKICFENFLFTLFCVTFNRVWLMVQFTQKWVKRKHLKLNHEKVRFYWNQSEINSDTSNLKSKCNRAFDRLPTFSALRHLACGGVVIFACRKLTFLSEKTNFLAK